MLVEMVGPCRVRVHPDLEDSISRAAAGQRPHTQVRRYDAAQGQVWVTFETLEAAQQAASRYPVQASREVGADTSVEEESGELVSAAGSDVEEAARAGGSGVDTQVGDPERRRRRLFTSDDE
jgi:hypothetical protein